MISDSLSFVDRPISRYLVFPVRRVTSSFLSLKLFKAPRDMSQFAILLAVYRLSPGSGPSMETMVN